MPIRSRDDRVAEIWVRHADGEWHCGSGYLVTSRLVITAAHVLGGLGGPYPDAEVKARFLPYGGRLWEARYLWHASDADTDVALIVVTDTAWEEPTMTPVRWGRLTCSNVGVECEATGYPDALQQPGETRERDQLSGEINPGTGVKARQYHVTVRDAPRRSAWPGRTPWGGMSGAAVFSGDLLIGIVIIDPAGFDGTRLVATRIDQVFSDASFVRMIASEDGGAPLIESAELAAMFAPPAHARQPRSPAELLRANVEAVRWFDERDEQLSELVTWCSAEEDAFAARLVIGAGGLGKTRLAQRLAVLMREHDWLTGMVLAETGQTLPAAPMSCLSRCKLPLLLIVDYSETRPDVVRRVIESLDVHGGAPTRLLMLARSAGQWWGRLASGSPQLEELLDPDEVYPLRSLPADPAIRKRAFDEAMADIAMQLPRVRGLPNIAWPELCAQVQVPDLTTAGYGSMMRLHLSALVGLLQVGPEPQPAGNGASHEKVLMGHERRYWERSAIAAGLHDLAETTRDNAVTISTLLGAADDTQAIALLGRVHGLRDADENLLLKVHRWLKTIYPPPTGGVWGALEPDRLGEYLVGTQLAEWPSLLDEPLAAAQKLQLYQAFHVLARASADYPVAGELLRRQVTSQLRRYGPMAVRVATETEKPDFLIAALEDAVADVDVAGVDVLVELAEAFPSRAPALNLLAERLLRLAIRLYERLVAEGLGNFQGELAQAWQRLADYLEENRPGEDAVRARENAVSIFRALTGREGAGEAEATDG